jgi:hypothetical protein
MARIDRDTIHVDLWITQWALAAAFHLLGLLKVFVAAGDLQQGFHLVIQAPASILRPVGLVELVGSLALVLPAATGILPRLTPLAAACLGAAAVMGAAMPATAAGLGLPWPNLVLAVGCAFVAWGRIARAPIAPLGLREASEEDRARHERSVERARRAASRANAPTRPARGQVA